ncbi:MAG: DEAD/DEAH box helicase [Desulfatirhabdiaceae bacterium]
MSNHLLLENMPPFIYDMLIHNLQMENPKWIENEKMGRWNRDTPHFLEFYEKHPRKSLIVPRGYLRQIITLSRQYRFNCELVDIRRHLPDISFRFKGELRSFQQTAVDAMLPRQFGALNAPTGSGKTVMAAYMIAARSQPSLIVVHTKELGLQWVNRLSEFLDVSTDEIGFIGGGKKSIGPRITVALVQSLYKCADEAAHKTGFLIVDECHRCPSRTFTEAVSRFDSRYMLGLSATPYRRDHLSKLIFLYLGDIHHQVDKHGLVQSGDILAATVIQKSTEFKPYFDAVREYSKMLAELTADDARNLMIAEDVAKEAAKPDQVCLVLSDRKHHCETLQAILRYRFDITSELLTGDIADTHRIQAIQRIWSGESNVLIATGQLVGEGFDCPGLSVLFLATPIRFSGRVLQYIGRVLRPAPEKIKATIYDYIDVHVGVLKHAAQARMKIYNGF